MDGCVACHQVLELEVEFSDGEDVEMGGSSSAAPSDAKVKIPDDVQLVRST